MKQGRPTKYKPEYDEQARKLVKLGATNEALADFFDVGLRTLEGWMETIPSFSRSVKETRHDHDFSVERSLRERALGYTHKEEKVFCSNGKIVTHVVEKHHPPDTAAAFIWLKNRQPKRWRDKQEITHSTDPDNPPTINIKFLDD